MERRKLLGQSFSPEADLELWRQPYNVREVMRRDPQQWERERRKYSKLVVQETRLNSAQDLCDTMKLRPCCLDTLSAID